MEQWSLLASRIELPTEPGNGDRRPNAEVGSVSVRSLVSSLVTLTISLLVCVLLAEMAVRLVRPQARLTMEPGGLYEPDPPGRYRLSPGYRGRIFNRVEYSNEIRVNQLGLRGPELEPSAADRIRILSIGDSFIFGVGVEDDETFVARLAEGLEERGQRAEALNGGIPAFGVPDAVGWFERHGATLDPDIVILGIFLGNDLVDASPDREPIVVVDGLLTPQDSPRGLRAWLYRHSQLYVALKSLSEQPGFLPLRQRLGLGEPWRVRVLREEYGIYKKTAASDLASAIAATDEALGVIAALAARNDFDLLAMLIPSEIQLDPDRWQAGLASLGLNPRDYDPDVPTRIFHGLLARHDIPTLDLTPVLTAKLAAGASLYFKFDRHWTAAGHAAAAQALSRALAPRTDSE